ncbi:MAG: FHA domain-containing protein [Myxococcaceae bacterium]
MKLIIEDDEGRRTVVPFVRDEITIGRQEGNTIRLTERNVSRRHARLLRETDSVYLEDLGSYNGVRVNGEKVLGRMSIGDGDLVQIGDYDLAIQAEGSQTATSSELAPTVPGFPRSLLPDSATQQRVDEPPTEASSPVYEEAEPVSDEEHTPVTSPTQGSSSPEPRRQSTAVIRVDKVEANRARPLLDLDPEEAPRLVVLNTEFAGREFACIRTELRIGRTDDNDICLDHRSLSRTHAKLVREVNGEWRILDMQSANGLTVNDESYAQATLNHLDVVELGHVRIKFIGVGETYTFLPAAEEKRTRRSGSKAPRFIGFALGAIALAGGGWYVVNRTMAPTTTPEPAHAEKPAAPAVQAARPAADSAKTKLDAARDAVGRNAFESAVEHLEGLKALAGVDAALLAEAENLLDQSRAELLLKKRLDQAEAAIEEGQVPQARALLKDSASTVAWVERHKALSEEADALADQGRKRNKPAARQQARVESAGVKVPEEAAEPQSPAVNPAVVAEAKKLFEDGTALFKKAQYREARTLFARCLDVAPTYAWCHLMLGSTYARMGEVDNGARHYRTFVKLAPNAEEARQVRDLLEQFEASKGSPIN